MRIAMVAVRVLFAAPVADRLGGDYQPHFVLVDADGRVVDTREGRGDAEIWAAMLAKLP